MHSETLEDGTPERERERERVAILAQAVSGSRTEGGRSALFFS